MLPPIKTGKRGAILTLEREREREREREENMQASREHVIRIELGGREEGDGMLLEF